MAHGVKLDTLSLDDLRALIDDAQKVLLDKATARRQEIEKARQKELAELDALIKPKAPATIETRPRPPRKKLFRHPVSGNEYGNTSAIPNEFKELGVKTKEDLEQYRIKD